MSSRVKIYIEMDQGWVWSPISEQHPLREYYSKQMAFEVNEELLTEYVAAKKVWVTVQEKLEHLFRVQEGMKEFGVTPGLTPVADYTKLEY